MSYQPTKWNNNAEPSLDAEHLNKLENGLSEAAANADTARTASDVNAAAINSLDERVEALSESYKGFKKEVQKEIADLDSKTELAINEARWEAEEALLKAREVQKDVDALKSKTDDMQKVLDVTAGAIFEEKKNVETGTSIAPAKAKLIEKLTEVFGKSEKSKNLLPTNIFDRFSVGQTIGTAAGVTTIYLGDGKYSYKGTATGTNVSNDIWTGTYVFKAGVTYSIKDFSPLYGDTVVKTITVRNRSNTFTPTEDTPMNKIRPLRAVSGESYDFVAQPMIVEGSYTFDNFPPYEYPYDGIHSIEEINVKTVGKNRLKIIGLGTISQTDGETISQSTTVYYSDYMRTDGMPWIFSTDTSSYVVRYFRYDLNKNYLGSATFSSGYVNDASAKYVRVQFDKNYVNPQIELGTSATQYAPYTEKSSLIPLASPLRGINDVRDRIYERTYKGMKSVDLGTLNWSYQASNKWFQAQLNGTTNSFALLNNYTYRATNDDVKAYDKSMRLTNNYLIVHSDSYGTDANAFKTAMNGVILHYEATEGGEDYTTFVCERDFAEHKVMSTDANLRYMEKSSNVTRCIVEAMPNMRARGSFDNALCNLFPFIAGGNVGIGDIDYPSCAIRDSSTGFTFKIPNSDNVNSLDDLKAWVTSHDLRFIYALATPTITELSAEAIEVIRTIKNIDADHHLIVTDNYGNDVTYILTYLVEKATDNVVLVAPNGTKWKLTVSNSGQLSAVAEN